MPQEQVKQFGQQSPMKRPAQPAELAPAYVFLASQDASYITGEVIGVTGACQSRSAGGPEAASRLRRRNLSVLVV